jgi:hypothetical protein
LILDMALFIGRTCQLRVENSSLANFGVLSH